MTEPIVCRKNKCRYKYLHLLNEHKYKNITEQIENDLLKETLYGGLKK